MSAAVTIPPCRDDLSEVIADTIESHQLYHHEPGYEAKRCDCGEPCDERNLVWHQAVVLVELLDGLGMVAPDDDEDADTNTVDAARPRT